MSNELLWLESIGPEYEEPIEYVSFSFDITRREFIRGLGAGLLITVLVEPALAQRRGGRGGGGFRGNARPQPIAARIHIAHDGHITVFTGKVEAGQGARTELTQAAAEELRVPADGLLLVMADTQLVPDDGHTAGSRSTPSSVPAVRQGCAAARTTLAALAAAQWKVPVTEVEARDGKIVQVSSGKSLGYGDLASGEEANKAFGQLAATDIPLGDTKSWKVMGTPVHRPNGRELVTGAHAYPSDVVRPGMMYGKILRPPSYDAKLSAIDLAPAKAMSGVVVVRDGSFIGVAAPTSWQAQQAIAALEKTAKWDQGAAPQPTSDNLFAYLKEHAEGNSLINPFAKELEAAPQKLGHEYHVAYIQHAPLEPRAAVAEWKDDHLTVWTGTQNPFGVRSELARAFRMSDDKVRVITPDFGGGFGGKHSGETAIETARLAREAKRPVSLRWTREEEFTWAYFRPAALIIAEAGLGSDRKINSWYFVNVNSGGSAVETPYEVEGDRSKCFSVGSRAPLRHGSYRALASTANNFARECLMDELAAQAGVDPLEFRLSHLKEGRLRAVLEEAAKHFDWNQRVKQKDPSVGVGLACGTEKGSYVAACVEIGIDRGEGTISVRRVCQAFECGAIINPANLEFQNRGAIVMGLGPALREAIEFDNGRILNASFRKYRVPHFAELPEIDIHLLNRPDLPSAGAGETPIIVVAPAIANAVFHATGQRVRQMPIQIPAQKT